MASDGFDAYDGRKIVTSTDIPEGYCRCIEDSPAPYYCLIVEDAGHGEPWFKCCKCKKYLPFRNDLRFHLAVDIDDPGNETKDIIVQFSVRQN